MTTAKTIQNATETSALNAVLREHAEQQFAEELDELKKLDDRQRPLRQWLPRRELGVRIQAEH